MTKGFRNYRLYLQVDLIACTVKFTPIILTKTIIFNIYSCMYVLKMDLVRKRNYMTTEISEADGWCV